MKFFFNDATTRKIYKANRAGRIEAVAGNGGTSDAIVGVNAKNSPIAQVQHLAFAPNGLLYFFESTSSRVLRIGHDGTIEQVGILSCADEPNCMATFAVALAVGHDGEAYLSTADVTVVTQPGVVGPTFGLAFRVRRSSAGALPILCGRTRLNTAQLQNLQPPADGSDCETTPLALVSGLTLNDEGHLVFSVATWHQVFRLDNAGRIYRIAGSTQGAPAGDEGPALAATLRDPTEIRVAADNSLLLVDDLGRRLRRIDPQGQIHAVAGNGGNLPPRSARSHAVLANDITVLANGDMMLADGSTKHILKISPSGSLSDATGAEGGASELGITAGTLTLRDPVAIVAHGNDYFFTDSTLGKLFHVHADQSVTVVAGTGNLANGSHVSDGDNGPAPRASLQPQALTVDALGNVFVHDNAGASIRKITPDGVITRVVGSGTGVHQATVSNQPATAAFLNAYNISLAIDPQGRLVFSDSARIWRIDADGMLRTIAGTGVSGYTGDGGAALSARLNTNRIAYGPDGALYLADNSHHVIRRIDLNGIITTVAGTGSAGNSGDQGPARSAKLHAPTALAFDGQGRLLLIDGNNQRLRRINSDGTIESIAGRLQPANLGPIQQSALAGAAALAFVKAPGAPAATSPAFANDGHVLLAATGTAAGVLRVGDAEVSYIAGRYPQENDVSHRARYRAQSFGAVAGIVWDAARQRAYISEAGTTAGKHRLWSVTASTPQDADTWTVAPLVNETGAPGRSDGAAGSAQLRQPSGLYLDTTEDALYIADTGNHAIRRLALATMTTSTIANASGRYGYAGDGGAAREALLYQPRAVTRCPNGDVIISDTGNHRVRRIEQATQRITTILGDGTPASSGQGQPATNFPVDSPLGLVCDEANHVFVTSRTTIRALPANEAGIVDGTGPVLTIFGGAPRLNALAAQANCLSGLVAVAPSVLLVSDECTGTLLELRR